MMPQHETIIIGTGFGGMCMAHKLKEAGRDDLLILEKADEVGGTWRENTYLGAECDIPSALYSYSFAPNPTWDFKWAKQPQIFQYLKDFASNYDLRRHIRFGVKVLGATFDSEHSLWWIKTDQGDYSCRFLVSAVGQLHHPRWPDIRGREQFEGAAFHSAQWDHEADLAGKSVGVIGCAASAVQLIPEVAQIAEKLTVYQRSANWVIDKGDRPYWAIEKWVAKYIPVIQEFYRFGIWATGEYIIYPIIRGAKIRTALARAKNRWDMKKHIKDPELRKTLTPDYPIGAKRILFSDKFYQALARDNVELVTAGIDEVTPDGIRSSGDHRQHDVIIYATGFHTNPFLKEIEVCGKDGVSLKEHWSKGAYAYLGVTTSGFPNLFFLYGPNTNTGHTSIVYKQEQQVGYVVQLIQRGAEGAVEVDEKVEEEFNQEMQERLAALAWAKVEASWYKDGEKVTNNWPGTSLEFKRRLKAPIWDHFSISETS